MERHLTRAIAIIAIILACLLIAAATLIPMTTGVNWVGDLLSEPLPPCYLGQDCSVGHEFKCEMRKQEIAYTCVR